LLEWIPSYRKGIYRKDAKTQRRKGRKRRRKEEEEESRKKASILLSSSSFALLRLCAFAMNSFYETFFDLEFIPFLFFFSCNVLAIKLFYTHAFS
jgi:hypothetical protein